VYNACTSKIEKDMLSSNTRPSPIIFKKKEAIQKYNFSTEKKLRLQPKENKGKYKI